MSNVSCHKLPTMMANQANLRKLISMVSYTDKSTWPQQYMLSLHVMLGTKAHFLIEVQMAELPATTFESLPGQDAVSTYKVLTITGSMKFL